jgi:glutathione S-transferase
VPVLWHLKVSPYNEKARWALDHKQIPHIRRTLDPPRHRAVARRLTGGRTFPVLVVDGEAIGDSTDIIAALERRHPDPPLYPEDHDEGRRALELEDFFDEELGPYARLLVVRCLLEDPELFLSTLTPDLSGLRRQAARAMFPLLRKKLTADFGIDATTIEHAFHRVRAAGSRFAAELEPSGYLVGNSFSVADLTLASMIAPVAAPREFPYPLPQRDHPLFEGVREAADASGMLRWARGIYSLHRGATAEFHPRQDSAETPTAAAGV